MRKSNYSEHQIVGALERAEAGIPIKSMASSIERFHDFCQLGGILEIRWSSPQQAYPNIDVGRGPTQGFGGATFEHLAQPFDQFL